MSVPILIGVDIGTARVKALGLALDGSELAQVEHATPWTRNGNQAEIDPGELAALLQATVAAIPAEIARGDHEGIEVVAIGIAGMGEAGVLIDRAAARSRPSSPGTIRAATSTRCAARSANWRSSGPSACASMLSRRLRRSSGRSARALSGIGGALPLPAGVGCLSPRGLPVSELFAGEPHRPARHRRA